MKVVIVGLGIQGKKRRIVAGKECTATVDPVHPEASYLKIEDVPLDLYDAALVCTPDGEKLPILKYLLSHQKHVLVEKPLVSTRSSDLLELGQIAKEKNVALYTAYNHRFEPMIQKLKTILDVGTLGQVYLAKFFYGNGTARDVRNSVWRDRGTGVLGDLGCHLLDLAEYLFGRKRDDFRKHTLSHFENAAYDYVVFGTQKDSPGVPLLQMEATLLSWKNTFTIDIFAEKGSAHLAGLCKWGPSHLVVRTRVLPSGKPHEEMFQAESPDPTWAVEYDAFKEFLREETTGIEKDIWIQETLNQIAGVPS